ncbi:MAG: hypothetical protein VB093_17075 [Propionicimonas sp.]|nr:hypothetical protein [Propionicimonas sp.]
MSDTKLTETASEPVAAPAPKKTRTKKLPVVVNVNEVQPGDVLGGFAIGRVRVGGKRTTLWEKSGTEVGYFFNTMRVEVVR